MRFSFAFIWLAAIGLGAILSSKADMFIGTFDTPSGTNSWYWETWSAASEIAFDPADDAAGDPNSGSMQLLANFASKSDYQQAVFTAGMNPAPNLTGFAKVALDIKVDADSALRANGTDAGHFEIILRLGSGWTWTSVSFDPLIIGDWTHIEANIPTVSAPDDTLNAFTLKIGDGDFTGPVKVHVDNIKLLSRPEPVTVVNAFNDESELTSWYWENWSVAGTPEFDPANDADGSATSGSLKLSMTFENLAGYQQSVFSTTLNPSIDGTTYSKIAMDVKVDSANSAKRTGQEDYGSFEIIGRNGPDWTWNSFTNFNLTDSGWAHLEATLVPPYDAIHHLTLKLGQNGFGGPVVLNVDNIVLLENTNKTIVPPTLSLQKNDAGLNLVASQLQAQYQRQSIYTVGSDFSWVGQTGPVTYSMELSRFPDPTAYSGFQAHIFLLPSDPAPANSDVDWSEPNIIFVDIIGQANGSTIASFRYKTNQAGGNTMIYNSNSANGPVGTLGTVTNATPTGKWSITFSGDTHVTLTAPDGSSTQVDMPADAASLFAGPLHAYFGVQPNQLVNIGQGVVVKKIEISGTTAPISDSFAGATLNTEVWAVAAADAKGVQVIGSETPWKVTWTTPAAGFVLQTVGTLSAPAPWTDVNVTGTAIGSTVQALLNQTNLPAGTTAFFRLIKR